MLNGIRTPTTITDIVFESVHVGKRVRQYANNRRTGNIIFHGPPGTGKSTLSKIVTEERRKLVDGENAAHVFHSSEMTEQTIEQIPSHWQLGRLGGTKKPYVIIEEVDQLSPKAQRRLRSLLDKCDIGHVILTTNHIHAVDPPLVDRCDPIEMPAVKGDQWQKRIRDLVSEAGLKISDTALDGIRNTCTGSVRDLLRGVEDYILEHNP